MYAQSHRPLNKRHLPSNLRYFKWLVPLWRTVSDMMRDMEAVISGQQVSEKKSSLTDSNGALEGVPLVRVYSGHDSTLLPLLAAFEAHDGKWVLVLAVCHVLESFIYLVREVAGQILLASNITGLAWKQWLECSPALSWSCHDNNRRYVLQYALMLPYHDACAAYACMLWTQIHAADDCTCIHAHTRWPPYASYVALELVFDKSNNSHGVRMIYNDKVLTMFGNKEQILAFDEFREKVKERMMPEDWEHVCRYVGLIGLDHHHAFICIHVCCAHTCVIHAFSVQG
jgi:hypothetical protein